MLAFCKETGPAGLIYHKSKESKKIDSKEIWMHKFIDRLKVKTTMVTYVWEVNFFIELHGTNPMPKTNPNVQQARHDGRSGGHDGYGEVCARALFRRLNASFGAQTTLFPHFWDQIHTNIHVLSPSIRVHLGNQSISSFAESDTKYFICLHFCVRLV